ncbi:tryptophan synthase subunit beta [Candidatus Peregrinibacteria bacterium RIFOXYB2_FULL_32_7]|nr:MAG: tryptophan synthase subunit beta [Candidatus Peregrinibacteria bacterium RIFOXYB2_FULL_32_7]
MYSLPYKNGHYGQFGGRYVPEILMPSLIELEKAFNKYKKDKKFLKDLDDLYKNYSGRPTPLYFCENLTKKLGGAKIFIKNEGLNHTGAHKINHCLGQILLAKRMGKKRVIAETGAGQHGVATASVAAKFGLKCTIYMGARDVARQRPNVFWMEQVGATVVPVYDGNQTLKDAVNSAMRDYIADPESHFLLGSALGPVPYPEMNTFFQAIIGREVKKQCREIYNIHPDYLVACVGGGSNAIGLFYEFLDDKSVNLIGVEAGGAGKRNAIRFKGGKYGVIEGYKSYFLQDENGNTLPTHSISAGLDYPGIGPGHAYLKETGRVKYVSATDKEVLKAFQLLAKNEGIISALESAHAVAYAIKLAPKLAKNKNIIVNLSGRGDKDLFIITEALGDKKFYEFLKSKV